MKKVLILLVAMALVFTGCGSSSQPTPNVKKEINVKFVEKPKMDLSDKGISLKTIYIGEVDELKEKIEDGKLDGISLEDQEMLKSAAGNTINAFTSSAMNSASSMQGALKDGMKGGLIGLAAITTVVAVKSTFDYLNQPEAMVAITSLSNSKNEKEQIVFYFSDKEYTSDIDVEMACNKLIEKEKLMYIASHSSSPEELDALLKYDDTTIKFEMLKNSNLSLETLEKLAKGYISIKIEVAKHKNASTKLLKSLAEVDDSGVRFAVFGNKNTDKETKNMIRGIYGFEKVY